MLGLQQCIRPKIKTTRFGEEWSKTNGIYLAGDWPEDVGERVLMKTIYSPREKGCKQRQAGAAIEEKEKCCGTLRNDAKCEP